MRHSIIKLFTVVFLLITAVIGNATDRYWVNGTGLWNDPNHWSESSGGNPGASVPTQFDNVIFDNNSFYQNGQHVIIKEKAICSDFKWETEKFNAVLKSKGKLFKSITNAEIEIHGSIYMGKHIQNQFFGEIILKAEQESNVEIYQNLNGNLVFNSENGSWNIISDLSSNKNINLISGKLNLNNNEVNCNEFIGSGNYNRSIDLGNAKIVVNKWDFEYSENLEFKHKEYSLFIKSEINEENFKSGDFPISVSSPASKAAAFKLDSLVETPTSCFSSTDGAISVYISGGTPNYTYLLQRKNFVTGVFEDTLTVTKATTSHIFSGLPGNEYRVRVSESGGALFQNPITVTKPPKFLAGEITVTNPLSCYEGSDASLKANPTGGNPPYTYSWFTYNFGTSTYDPLGQTTQEATGLPQGLYKVEVRDQKNCGTGGFVSSEYVFMNPPDDVNIPDSLYISSTSSTNSCGGAADGTITIIGSGGTGDIDYYVIIGGTPIPASMDDDDGIISGLLPGTYETYAIDANLCTKRGPDVVVGSSVVPTANAGVGGSTCGLFFNLNASPSVGTGTWTKSVGSGSASFTPNANIPNPTVTVSTYGAYTFTWTENNIGCIDSDDVNVTFNETPVANAGSDRYVCNTLVATLAATVPTVGTGTWTKVSGPGTVTFGNANLNSSTATVSLYGTYVLRWTVDNSGCSHSDDVTVAYAEQASAGPDQNVCGVLVATLAGNIPSAGTGTWTKISGPGNVTFGDASVNNTTATVSQYGSYVLQWAVNNNGGCSTTDQVTINYSATADAGPDQNLCGTFVATLAALDPGAGTGTWSKVSGPGTVTFGNVNSINSTATVSQYGIYVLRWTIDNGGSCSTQDDVTINYADQAAAGPDQNLCNILVATLAANNPVLGTGTWSKVSGPGTVTFGNASINNTTATVSASGTYVLRWTVANGSFCSTQDDVTISFADLADAGADQELCGTFTATLAGNIPTAGTGTWTKVSGPGTVTFSNANFATSSATVSLYGSYVLRWTIDNGGSCSTQDDVTINYADQANAGTDQNLCNTLIATLSANAPTYGAGTWTKVSGPGTVTFGSANVNNTTATVSLPGTYILRWTVANGLFCSTQDDVTLSFAEQAAAGPDQNLCGVLVATLAGNTPSAGTGTWTKVSGPGTVNFNNANSATSTATVSLPGTYVLRWTINNGGGCSTQDEVTINFSAAANAGADQYICGLFVATLAANTPGVGTGTWTKISGPGNVTFGNINTNNTTATVDAYGIYVLRWTINNGAFCSTFDEVTIYYADQADAGPDQNLCGVLTTTMAGNIPTVGIGTWTKISGPGTVSFTNANLNTTSVSVSLYGSYVLRWTISNSGNCSTNDNVTINFSQAPIVFAGIDTLLCFASDYKILDADTTYTSTILWKTLGDGSFDFTNIIDPTYTPGSDDLLKGYADLVLTASSSNPLCTDQTDTIRVNYLPELIASIGKPSPYLIDSSSTHIDVNVKLSGHRYIPYLGVYLVSPVDSIVELKPYCTNILPVIYNQAASYSFYNDPLDTSSLGVISACNPPSGSYKFSGDWKKLHGQDPANGVWKVRIIDNRNWGDYDGVIEEASISFKDLNSDLELEQVLYADNAINKIIEEYDGSGSFAITDVSPSITGIQTSCFGSCDATLVGTGYGGQSPYVTYEWSTSLGFGTVFAFTDTIDVCAGKYYLRITDSHGCIAIDSVTVTEPPEIVITNDSIENISCYGDSTGVIMLEFSGGTGTLEYTIDSIDWFASGHVFSNLGAGIYTIVIRDLSGCSIDTTITLTQPDSIEINVTHTDVTCWGDSDGTITILALGGQGPLTYSIDSGATYFDNGGIFTGLPGDTFYVSVMDSVGCEQFWGPEIVVEPDSISVDSLKIVLLSCVGGGVDGQIVVYSSGGVGDHYYSIDGGPFTTDSSFVDLAEGFYQIAVRDDNGCTMLLDSLIHITYAAPILVDSLFITDVTGCYGDSNGEIRVYASGGAGVLEYSFRGVSQASNQFTGLIAGTDTIFISDEAGCQIDTVITLNQPNELLITSIDIINIRNCININELGEIVIHANGGTGVGTFLYSVDEGSNAFADSSFIDLPEGTYYIYVEDANGCVAVDTVEIITPEDLLIASDVQDIYCVTTNSKDPALSNGRIISSVTGGELDYTFQWSGPSGYSSTNDTISNLSEAGVYTLIVSDNRGCEQYDTITIGTNTQYDILYSFVLDRDTLCSYSGGINFELTTTAVDTILWQITEEGGIVPPVQTTIVETSPQIVHFDPLVSSEYRIVFSNEFCYDEYPEGSEPKIEVHVNQGVGLSILDDQGDDNDTIDVKVNVASHTLIGQVQNIAISATYTWDPVIGIKNVNSLVTDVTPDQPRWYYLNAITTDNCAEIDSIFINYIANVDAVDGFSPNGDGINDYWNIKNIDNFPNNVVQVFTRWGVKVFIQEGYSNDDPDKRWDGTTDSGKELPVGTYYYIIITNEPGYKPITGPVTIVR